jgi:hypothetical protein
MNAEASAACLGGRRMGDCEGARCRMDECMGPAVGPN